MTVIFLVLVTYFFISKNLVISGITNNKKPADSEKTMTSTDTERLANVTWLAKTKELVDTKGAIDVKELIDTKKPVNVEKLLVIYCKYQYQSK